MADLDFSPLFDDDPLLDEWACQSTIAMYNEFCKLAERRFATPRVALFQSERFPIRSHKTRRMEACIVHVLHDIDRDYNVLYVALGFNQNTINKSNAIVSRLLELPKYAGGINEILEAFRDIVREWNFLYYEPKPVIPPICYRRVDPGGYSHAATPRSEDIIETCIAEEQLVAITLRMQELESWGT